MAIVAINTVVYGNNQVAQPGTPFDPGSEIAAELLEMGAAREPTEAETAAWELVESAKAPAPKKSAKDKKADEEAAAKAAAEAEAAAKEAEEAAAKAAAEAEAAAKAADENLL
jgi:hypothetical protein